MSDQKYEYHNPGLHSVVPNLVLAPGAEGLIKTVGLYDENGRHRDVVHGPIFLSLPYTGTASYEAYKKFFDLPGIIADFTDHHIELACQPLLKHGHEVRFDPDEFILIRELERELLAGDPNYRIQQHKR